METIEKDNAAGLQAKNDFRDEVAREQVTPEEEIRRGQAVHLLLLGTRKKMTDADQKHIKSAIRMQELSLDAVKLMQDCEYKDFAIDGYGKQIEGLQQRLEAAEFGEINNLTLKALEELMLLRVNQETIED